MRGSALAGLACAAGVCASLACVPIDPYRGPIDAPDGTPLVGLAVVGDPSASVEVVGEGFRVRFPSPPVPGPRFPEHIELGGMPVLGTHENLCSDDTIGIRLVDVFTAAPTKIVNAWPGTDLDLTVKGPAHVRANLVWEHLYVCNGANQRAAGTSHFSFFPDGRIVRYDAVTPSTTTLAAADGMPCGCDTAPDLYWLQSHIVLKNAGFARYHFARVDQPAVFETAMMPVRPSAPETGWITSPNPIWACLGPDAGSSGPYVGIVWTSPSPVAEDDGTRIKPHYGGGEETTVLAWDWIYAHIGSNAVPPTLYETRTTLFLGTGGEAACDGNSMQQRVDAFNAAPVLTLLIDGGMSSATVPLDRTDGVYHWDPSTLPTMSPRMYEVRSSGPIATSHAISVLLPEASDPFVLKNGESLVPRYHFLSQPAEVTTVMYYRHTLWFPGPWNDGDVLVIQQ